MTKLHPVLVDALAVVVAGRLADASVGHCMRIDEVSNEDASELASGISAHVNEELEVYALGEALDHGVITVESAIALRNDKSGRLVLVVPTQMGHAASSLDNSFERIELAGLMEQAADEIERTLAESPVASHLRTLKRRLRRSRKPEAWAMFLAELVSGDSARLFGPSLWIVGLIPDFGPVSDVVDRLERNVAVTRAIAHAPRPTSSPDDRLADAGVSPGDVTTRLARFLTAQATLVNASAWQRRLAEEHPRDLTLDAWPLTAPGATTLDKLDVLPFRNPDGTVVKSSKLQQSADLSLYLDVSQTTPGKMVVQWQTHPRATDAVAQWAIDVLPPDDLRDDDPAPTTSTRVKGDKRRATITVQYEDLDLATGALFVVRVRAVDSAGSIVSLADGDYAEADSESFEIRVETEDASSSKRSSTAPSIADALVDAAVRGAPSVEQDLPRWDPDGQVFEFRIGGVFGARVRQSALLRELQTKAMESRGGVRFEVRSLSGEPVTADSCHPVEFELPANLAKRRKAMFAALATDRARCFPSLAEWTEERLALASAYVGAYEDALKKADDASAVELSLMDTVAVEVPDGARAARGTVILPTHPLRLAWIAAHYEVKAGWATELIESGWSKVTRSQAIDLRLSKRVSPANMPFSLPVVGGGLEVYTEELSHGIGVYVAADRPEPEALISTIYSVLGLPREPTALNATADLVSARIDTYLETRGGLEALSVAGMNIGDAALLARAVRPHVIPQLDSAFDSEPVRPMRLESVVYSNHPRFADPVPHLRELQADAAELGTSDRRSSFLAPPVGISVRPTDAIGARSDKFHMAFLQDISVGTLDTEWEPPASRAAAFRNLLTPLMTRRADEDGTVRWRTVPAMSPRERGLGASVVDAHRAHQEALARSLGGGSVISLSTELLPESAQAIRSLHHNADWVVTLDRFVGLDLYDDSSVPGVGTENYVLDYAPDFVEGLAHRVTVTTSHRTEVMELLKHAMVGLGLDAVETSVGSVLDRLNVVSGRLALRLIGDSTQAREAVSLAALIAHLDRRDLLGDTIVVPGDAHQELFGASGAPGSEITQRCDLLLVRLTQRKFTIECVEVKSRKASHLPLGLANDIVDQLEDTRDLLISRFFEGEGQRLDSELQRARLAGLLHYYADRAHTNRLISEEKLPEIHSYIDRIEERAERAEITMRGYVLSLEGSAGFPSEHRGVPISVITASDVGEAGFSTLPVMPSQAPDAQDPSPADDHSKARPHVVFDEKPTATPAVPKTPPREEPPSNEPVSPPPASPWRRRFRATLKKLWLTSPKQLPRKLRPLRTSWSTPKRAPMRMVAPAKWSSRWGRTAMG